MKYLNCVGVVFCLAMLLGSVGYAAEGGADTSVSTTEMPSSEKKSGRSERLSDEEAYSDYSVGPKIKSKSMLKSHQRAKTGAILYFGGTGLRVLKVPMLLVADSRGGSPSIKTAADVFSYTGTAGRIAGPIISNLSARAAYKHSKQLDLILTKSNHMTYFFIGAGLLAVSVGTSIPAKINPAKDEPIYYVSLGTGFLSTVAMTISMVKVLKFTQSLTGGTTPTYSSSRFELAPVVSLNGTYGLNAIYHF